MSALSLRRKRRPPSLEDLLVGGVGGVLTRHRLVNWPRDPLNALKQPRISQTFQVLYGVREVRGASAADVEKAIEALAKYLASSRPAMLAVLFCAGEFPAVLADAAEIDHASEVDHWCATTWMAEAAWRALHSRLTDRKFAVDDRKLLVPLAARLRFLTLAQPMRNRGAEAWRWVRSGFGRPEPVLGVFGDNTWHLLVGRCREARRAWLECLNAYQSHPYLALTTPAEREQELAAVLFRDLSARPLVLSAKPLPKLAELTAEDTAVLDEATERHLLPRFDVARVARLSHQAARTRDRRARWAVTALAGGAALTAAAATVSLRVHLATWLAAVFYGLIWFGAVVFGKRWTASWLLRLPAASAVGLFVLISLNWWADPRVGWAATTVLGAASFGYLTVEARNHEVNGYAALRRALLVWAIGVVHALMTSLIGLVAVAPAFATDGAKLADLWRDPGGGAEAGAVLMLATAWCLTVGVFSQILWEDRPITASLAHMRWRNNG